MTKLTVGRIEVKGLGIILDANSTEEEILKAVKHQPSIAQFVSPKPKTDASGKKDNK